MVHGSISATIRFLRRLGEGLVYAEITGTVRELRKQLEAAQQVTAEIAALGMVGIPQRIRRKWKQLSRKSPR